MKWFGESWGTLVNETCARIAVPDGECCPRCGRSIRPGDRGAQLHGLNYDGTVGVFDFHLACFRAELGIGPEPSDT